MKNPTVDCWRLTDVLGGIDLLRADVRRLHFPRHFHTDYTFGLVTRGANRFLYRGRRIVAPTGTICLADPGEVHTGEADEDGWSYWTIHVAPAAVAALRAELDDQSDAPPDFVSGVIEDPQAVAAFARFFRCALNPGLERQSHAVMAIARLIGGHSGVRQPSMTVGHDERAARLARDILGDRFNESVRLDELAAAAGTGRYRLLRAFRARFGLPPHAWQVQMRVAHARAAIAGGTPIVDAAAAAGFSDQAHLTRAFRRYLGYTPGAVVPDPAHSRCPPGRHR
jgi:AraC-like DNA-binding protein